MTLRWPQVTAVASNGSVLIIVLWVAFGLVSLALYFAHSMSLELRAADNRCAAVEAQQAIAGAVRYASNILANLAEPGTMPQEGTYRAEAVPVGEATFWFLGRSLQATPPTEAVFGFADEAAKLNLNTATLEMLQTLPRMTAQLAASIIDWRDTDSDVSSNGAETDYYSRLRPGYRCKDGNFESIEELRLVAGADLEILYGEDTNLNGVLDANENDGDISLPSDDRNGRLDAGILEYLTVFSREPNTRTNGSARINVAETNQVELSSLLEEKFGQQRARQVLAQVRAGGTQINSVLAFYLISGMTETEFVQIEADITTSTNTTLTGLVNVNTASEAVLACLPGVGTDGASTLVAVRQSNGNRTPTVAWVAQALDRDKALQAGPYLTSRSYQYSLDVAAVGHHDRGYRRERFVVDTSDGTPKVVSRRDLTPLGWALGQDALGDKLLARYKR